MLLQEMEGADESEESRREQPTLLLGLGREEMEKKAVMCV